MASTWTRLRLHYIGNIRISRLVTPLITLLVLYVIYRLMRSPKYGVVNYKDSGYPHRMLTGEMDEYLEALRDTRPQRCRDYHVSIVNDKRPTVSILVDFHEDEIYNLKLTLSSIIRSTPQEYITEIVVLDDGTSNYQIRQHAAEFLLDERFKKKIRPFRSQDRHGQASTRFKASRVAQGDVLVFVSSSVVVNHGWIEPLLTALLEKPNRIVVPHADNFLSEKRFFKMDENLVTTFTWPLNTVYKETVQESKLYLDVPVMRGDVFAVSKNYFDSIGNYDDGLEHQGGENLELSLRVWMCGGQIVQSTCSRVATHNALKPIDVNSDAAIRRISELWLDGSFSDVTFKQTQKNRLMDRQEEESLIKRRSYLKKNLQCQPFDWYLRTIVRDVIVPSHGMVQFGKLSASSSYCTRGTSDLTEVLDMVSCRPFLYEHTMMFEFDEVGRIRKGHKCMMAPGRTSRIILADCQDNNNQQQWRPVYGKMISDAFPGMCLTHVRETGDDVHVHYAALVACVEREENPKQIWTFIRY